MMFDLELKKKKLKNPVMFVGLPGIGLVGKIVVEYLANNAKAEKIGTLHGSIFPPVVLVNEDKLIELIKDDIYLLRCKEQDFVLFTGDVQPFLNESASEQHYYFAKKIVDIAKQLKVKKIYTFAGIDIGDARITQKPNIFFAANSLEEKEYLQKQKLKSAEVDLSISGAAGLVVAFAGSEKISGACILGETSSKLIYGDFESAKNILKHLKKTYNINIDLKDIEKEAKKITKAFKQIVDELKKASEKPKKEDKLTYIR